MKILVFLVVFLSGCAPLTDQQRYDRENALIVARDDFAIRQLACRNSGGTMAINGWRAGFKVRHSVSDYKLAQCIRM